MKRYDSVTPEGVGDLIFGQCDARKAVLEKLDALFRLRSYREVMTPGFEFYDVFDKSSRYFPQEDMFKLTDNRGRIMVARPDLTVPIARVVATRLRGCKMPLRLCASQNIYRNSPALGGKKNEIMQSGVELIGSDSYKADAEVISLAAQSFECCGINDFRIEIGHIGIFKELIGRLDCPAETKELIRDHIESKNYASLSNLLSSYVSSDGESGRAATVLGALPKLFGGEEVFAEAKKIFAPLGDCDSLKNTLDYLRYLYSTLRASGLGDKLMVDFGLVNQAEYYTGVIFRGYSSGAGEAAVSGGRYDGLIKEFGENLPAVGFGINVDCFAAYLERTIPEKSTDVLVFCTEEHLSDALLYMKELTDKGIFAEFSFAESENDAETYAKQNGIPSLVTVSDSISEKKIF